MLYQQFIESALKETSIIANNHSGKVTGQVKGTDHNQIITETDLTIGKLLVEKIKLHFPDYNIIDEETGVIDKKSEYTWVIDPIDGTSNFAAGVPQYGTMIGLLHKAVPIAGGIANPY